MRVLLTGHRGYIGTVMTPMLLDAGHEVVGLDTELYETCTFGDGQDIVDVPSIRKDIRDVTAEDLAGYEAVIHLAALSNDPLGDLNPSLTDEINHAASVRLARLAKEAGVERFIFSSSCSNYGAAGTGFNAASAASRGTTRGADERLLDCLIHQYGATTGLPRHFGITDDMTFYHTFAEVSDDTPVAIIELGFMLNDRRSLTEQQDLLAQGIANGVRCFLRPDVYGRPPSSSLQP